MRLRRWHHFDVSGRRFATVAFETTRDGPGVAHRIDLRWAATRERLSALGVPSHSIDLIGERVTVRDGRPGAGGRYVVASEPAIGEAEIVLDVPLPEAPQEVVTYAVVPDLLPLVRSAQRHPTYLQVDIDRTGADVSVRGPIEDEVEADAVTGEHDVIHKVRAGEASEQRLHRRAEDSWERNATEVARHLDALTRRHNPAVVAVAGDDRAISALQQHVSEEVRARLVVLDTGGRAPGVDEDAEDAALRRALDGVIAREVEDATSRLLEAEGRQERAAQGRDNMVQAFRRGQVETLLLSDPPAGNSIFVGEDGLPRHDETGETVDSATAFAAAAFATDAEVVLVPAEVTIPDGVAAVLRWADESTPHDSGPSMPGHGEQPGWQP